MNDDKNAHGNAQNENKLDQWIKQNIIGEHKAEEKIVHQDAPHSNKTAVPPHPNQPPKKEKRGFFFGKRKDKLAAVPGQPQGQPPRPQPAQQSGQPQSRPPQPPRQQPRQQQQHPGRQQQQHPRPQQSSRPSHFQKQPSQIRQAPVVPASQAQAGSQHFTGKLRVVPLGGLEEVGKNCMALEYGNDIIIIDLGFHFPDEDMLGVDYVIPDISYLNDKLDRIRGIIFTHGHLDHIGAVPYLAPKLNFPPMFGTRLTMGLVEKRLEEFGMQKEANMSIVKADDTIQLGAFNVNFFHVNHSIPDSVGVLVKTPAGNIVHTGDFKFDFMPSGDQRPADFNRIASLALQGVAAIFIDSTNASKPGYTISEKKIGDSLEQIIKSIEGRIIIASFASQIGRMQQIINYAVKYGRTVFLSGRSLIDNIFMAKSLGYLKVPEGLIHDVRKVKKIPPDKCIILTTGSQGEDVSALTRMALEEHPAVQIQKGDTVVLSSSPIPGNERAITNVTNNLCRLGAKVINNQIMDVHASGHAQQEDLKLMISLVRPKYVVPIHGEYYMRTAGKDVAMSIGYTDDHVIIIENGGVLEIENNEVKVSKEKITTNYVLVDGLGVGDIGAQVIMDRQTLAENGVLIMLIPVDEKSKKLKGEVDIISRGFIYMKESEELIKLIKTTAEESYRKVIEKQADPSRADVKKYMRESIDKLVHQKIERHPLVIPIIVEK